MIDTHCHLDVAEFNQDRIQVINNAFKLGIQGIIIPGIHATGFQNLLNIAANNTQLYPALGLHPLYLQQHTSKHLDYLVYLIKLYRPIAIGEIGLDYWDKNTDKTQQQYFFEAQLSIATSFKLPVLLHVRKAHDQVLRILRHFVINRGIVHAFNGSFQQAHKYIDMGFKLGFGGMLTYTGSRKLHSLAKSLPAQALVLETDAPDLTVASHRGERNSPEYLPECLNALAQIRNEQPEFTALYTTTNAYQIILGTI